MGVFKPAKPSIPTPPPPPAQDPAELQAAEEAARIEKERLRRGFRSTLLSSSTQSTELKTTTGQ